MSERRCKSCGCVLVRRFDEKASKWAKRKTCNFACAGKQVATVRNALPSEQGLVDEERFAMSHEEIAKALGMSRQNVQLIEKRAIEKLRRIGGLV